MLVTIASCREPWTAHILCGRLTADGLLATVAHEHHISALWQLSTALGGAKIQVPHWQAEEAVAILLAARSDSYRAALEAEWGPLDEARCPHCGAADPVGRPSLSDSALLVAVWFCFSVIFPLRAASYRCGTCSARWPRA